MSLKNNKSTLTVALLTTLSLVVAMFTAFVTPPASAALPGDLDSEKKGKLDRISPDLRAQMRKGGDTNVKIILQLDGKMSGNLNALLSSNGVKVKKQFANFNSFAVELPAYVVDALSSFPEVAFVSVDSEVRSLGGHVSKTSGADQVRSLGTDGNLDGSGVGIAILDSGIYSNHVSFKDTQTGLSRVVVNQDFTGEGRTDDPYGHGTHVAAAAAGNGIVSRGRYIGIAPRAKLINLRVLNSQGVGSVSGLLSALNWLVDNAATYNVRVVNMSIGMPAINSYKNDPICIAVRKLVDRGLVAVAAAGNNGKNPAGQKTYGHIHSPGNEPSALTVGAVDTRGTDTRSDDTIATYSSRGPTRSGWTDVNGALHHDHLVKPEISAPGNKTIFAMSPNNYLVSQNPTLNAGVSPLQTRNQMRLSGTSMASPLVAGTAALMLEANPSLSPNLIKTVLMYTAQQLPNFNTLEQGAGQLNVDGAVRLAKLVRSNLTSTTALGEPLLDWCGSSTSNDHSVLDLYLVTGCCSWSNLRYWPFSYHSVSKGVCQGCSTWRRSTAGRRSSARRWRLVR